MTSNDNIPSLDQGGQVLPASVLLLAAVLLFIAFMLGVGRLVIQKEEARMRTDLVAYSVGVDYSRVLNLCSISNKVLAASAAAKLAGALFPALAGWSLLAPSPAEIQKAQDLVVQVGPCMVLAEAEWLGHENGLDAVLRWNQEDGQEPSFKPDFNLRRRYLGEVIAGLGSASRETYTYVDEDTGEVIEIEKSRVHTEYYRRKSGRRQRVYRAVDAKGRSIFVKRTPASQDLPWDLAETGPHNVLVTAACPLLSDPSGLFHSSLSNLPLMMSKSKVEVGGGNMEISQPDAASYGAYLIPVSRDKSAEILH
jgi:hypothetical protein